MDDRTRLRELAKQWMEIAALPQMEERRNVWRGMNGGKYIRPAVFVETVSLVDFVEKKELLCSDKYLRGIERMMLETIKHYYEIPDDLMVEPEFYIPWEIERSNFGVDIELYRPSGEGDHVAFGYHHPVHNPEDAYKVKNRTFSVNREISNKRLEMLNDLFGDILPVKIGGFDPAYPPSEGYTPFNGQYVTEVTLNLYRLIGMDNIYFWLYDHPEIIERLMKILTADFVDFYKWMEKERLLLDNRKNFLTGGHYGYMEDSSEPSGEVSLNSQWIWCNAEEMTSVSPDMLEQFVLPFLKNTAEVFGYTYFGCCERIDDRWDMVKKVIPNLKAVSVSAFSDIWKMGEKLSNSDIVFSRKPIPQYLSIKEPEWELLKKDLEDTAKAARNCKYEFILRDVYQIFGDRERLKRWTLMAKAV
ncbi:MAG TPA: hypothetical protein GXX14_03920 [Clostridiaceae bacterium]|nr:hypothetical protein [Clostridiaceae bacterium]